MVTRNCLTLIGEVASVMPESIQFRSTERMAICCASNCQRQRRIRV